MSTRGVNVTDVVVARHGETVWNVVGRQQGHLDSPLTELGERQARAIADGLAKERFAALYSSDLGRAMRTARTIGATLDLPVVADPRLRERNLGVFEGLTWEEAAERYPQEVAAFRGGDPDYVIPGGESARQRYERTTGCVGELAGRHAGERIVVVAHGGVVDGLYRMVMGIDLARPRDFKLCNASINRLRVCGRRWEIVGWGGVAHLAGLPTLDDR